MPVSNISYTTLKPCIFFVLLFAVLFSDGQKQRPETPNIVILYADDLGYGDLGCYGAVGVKTPNIDRLAKQGIRFTDAHSSASTCTPSRFSLLTGSYAFRNKAEILPGDAPLLIRPGVATLPEMLRKTGYATAAIGKWHLGLGDGTVDWNKEIKPGAGDIGFDYSFLIPATGDRVPTVYVENGYVKGASPGDPLTVSYLNKTGPEPTGLEHPELLKLKADSQHSQTIVNGVSRIGFMSGGRTAYWKDEHFADVFTDKAIHFIKDNKHRPFFLYYAFQDIHVPRLPNQRFRGKSTMGSRGDAIVQMDWVVGKVMGALKASGLEKNTLVIFSSDNGPILDDGYDDKAEALLGKHKPAGPFRGGKYSAYEGGTRMPMIAAWEGRIKPAVSNALFSQVDLYASLAHLVGNKLPENAAPDSEQLFAALCGESEEGRSELLEEAFVLAIRKDNWKYIEPGTKAPEWLQNKKVETALSDEVKLFDLAVDPGEQNNLAGSHPDKVMELKKRLDEIRSKRTRDKMKAETPPMGWNSWNWFGKKKINEKVVMEVIDEIEKQGLQKAGYNYVVVDGGWRAAQLGPQGELLADSVKFPHGMKMLAAYAHSRGLKFGLHTVPGTHDCIGDQVGGFGHEDIQMQQFIDWGVDFIKLDLCRFEGGWNEEVMKSTYSKWNQLINKSGANILLSISAYKFRDWYPSVGQMARTTEDISTPAGGMSGCISVFDDSIPADKNKWDLLSVMQIAEENNKWAKYAGPGFWNDPDMLVTGEQGLSMEEQKAHFALWCIMSAPLMLGNDPRNMRKEEKDIILNSEAIMIDQDITEQGKRIKVSGKTEVWAKRLQHNRVAVLLLNRDKDNPKEIKLDLPDIGITGRASVKDVYSGKTIGTFTRSFSGSVGPHSGLFLLIE